MTMNIRLSSLTYVGVTLAIFGPLAWCQAQIERESTKRQEIELKQRELDLKHGIPVEKSTWWNGK